MMEEKDFNNSLWKYFEIHSNQRMQMMHFYILLESLFITGLVALFSAKKDMKFVETGICVTMIFFSFVFWGFDRRTREMIHNCEDAIKSIESKYSNQSNYKMMIFTEEEVLTRMRKTWSYTKLMKAEYTFFCVLAIIMMLYIWYQTILKFFISVI